MRSGRPIVAIVLSCLTFSHGSRAGAESFWGVLAELAPELDSNALRATDSDQERTVESSLVRAFVRARIDYRSSRYRARMRYGAGGKLFVDNAARRADEALHFITVNGLRKWGKTWLGLRARYDDSFQRSGQDAGFLGIRHDFRGANVVLSLSQPLVTRSEFSLDARLGYRGFLFKADNIYDFHGPFGRVSVSWQPRSGSPGDGRISSRRNGLIDLSYALARRDYRGAARLAPTACDESAECPQGQGHRALNHAFRLSAYYMGLAQLSLWYGLEINDDNSFGESYLRQMVGLKFTTEVFDQVYFSASALVQVSRLDEPLALRLPSTSTAALDLEEESRSRVGLYLARDIYGPLSLGLRYNLFLNESGTNASSVPAPRFLRQTVALVLRLTYNSQL